MGSSATVTILRPNVLKLIGFDAKVEKAVKSCIKTCWEDPFARKVNDEAFEIILAGTPFNINAVEIPRVRWLFAKILVFEFSNHARFLGLFVYFQFQFCNRKL
jgi:hypothetical protein